MLIYIILIIIILVIININKKQIIKENFTTDDQNQIKQYINEIYKADIEAIRNLSNYAGYLMGTNSITAPGTIRSTSNLCVNDKCLNSTDIDAITQYTRSGVVNVNQNHNVNQWLKDIDNGIANINTNFTGKFPDNNTLKLGQTTIADKHLQLITGERAFAIQHKPSGNVLSNKDWNKDARWENNDWQGSWAQLRMTGRTETQDKHSF
jgi:hypothetical protein